MCVRSQENYKVGHVNVLNAVKQVFFGNMKDETPSSGRVSLAVSKL